MQTPDPGPYLSDDGTFFGIVGAHSKLHLIREMLSYTETDLRDYPPDLWSRIRVWTAHVIDREDTDTWDDATHEAVADSGGGWPFEWDNFMTVAEDGPIVVTVYQETWSESDR